MPHGGSGVGLQGSLGLRTEIAFEAESGLTGRELLDGTHEARA